MDIIERTKWALSTALVFMLIATSLIYAPPALAGDEAGASADVYYAEAVSHFIDEDFELALDRVERALEQDPDHVQAVELLEMLEELLESPEDEAGEEARHDVEALTEELQDPDRIMADRAQDPNDVDPELLFDSDLEFEAPVEPPQIHADPLNVVRHFHEQFDQPEGRTRAVYGLEAREYPDRVRVIIQGSRSLDYIVSEIFDPAMLVIDIPNAVDELPEPPLNIGLKDVIRARHSQYRVEPINTTRVVLDLERWHDHFQVYRDTPGNRVVVDVFDVERIFPGVEDPDITDIFRQVHPELYYQLERVQGHGQSIGVPRQTSDPMIARFLDENGEPLANEDVRVSVREGEVRLAEHPDDEFVPGPLQLRTDDRGQVRFYARSLESSGPVEIVASVDDYDLLVNYRLDVESAEPVGIEKVHGDRQETLFGERTPEPLIVEARDRFDNPVPDAMVTFESLTRGAFLDADPEQAGLNRRIRTDSHGRVEVGEYRIAPDREENLVRATLLEVDEQPSTTFTIFGRPNVINLNIEGAPLTAILPALAEIANINLVFGVDEDDERLHEDIDIFLTDVTPLRAMDTILGTQGFARVMEEDVVTVVDLQEAIARGVYEGFDFELIRLQHEALSTTDEDLADRLRADLPLGDQGRIISQPRTNEILVYGEPTVVERVANVVEIMDQPGRLQENFRFIDMEGFDSEIVAAQVNRILGMDVAVGVDVTALRFTDPDPEDIREIIREERRVNIEELLERAQIMAIPELQQILVFGPPDLVDTAEAMIQRIREMGEGYIERQNFEWYQADNIPFEEAQSLINRMGNVQTFSRIEYLEAFLLSSPDPEALETALTQLREIDSSELPSFAYDVVRIERADPTVVMDRLDQILGVAEDVVQPEQVLFFAPLADPARPDPADLEEVVTEMNAVLLEEADSIMLIGPSRFRSFAKDLIREIEDSFVELDDYHWEWYSVQMLGMEKVGSMVGRFPGVDIEHTSPERDLILLRSSEENRIEEFREIMSRVDTTEIAETGREIVVYSPQFIDVNQLVDDIETYFEDIDAVVERERELPRVVYSDEFRAVFSLRPADASLLREIIQKLDSDAFFDHTVLNYFPVNLSAEDLEDELMDELNLATVLHVSEERISLLVPQDRREETLRILRQIDESGYIIDHVELNHRRAHDVVDVLAALLDDDQELGVIPDPEEPGELTDVVTRTADIVEDIDFNVSLTADPGLNRIVFTTPRENRNFVRDIISEFDVRAKQVYVEGVMAEYTLEEGFEFNPFWNFLDEDFRIEFGQDPPIVDLDASELTIPDFPDRIFTGVFQGDDLQIILDFLEDDLDGKIVARPQISTLNNQRGIIELEETRFAEQTEVTDGIVTTTLTEEVAETLLQITPTITKNRDVLLNLDIQNEVFVSPDPQEITTESRASQSQLYVEDGQTIVVGGLIQDEIQVSTAGIPFLRHIPLIGNLFSSYEEIVTQNELVVFLTPHVMETGEEVDRFARERIPEEAQFDAEMSININTDSFRQLERLFSLSDAPDPTRLAAAADDYRRNEGPFISLGDLLELPGVDPLILEQIMHRVELAINVNSATTRQLSRIRNFGPQIATALSRERDLRIRFNDFDDVRHLLLDWGVDVNYIDDILSRVMVVDSDDFRTEIRSGMDSQREEHNLMEERADATSFERGDIPETGARANVEDLDRGDEIEGEFQIERDVHVRVGEDTEPEDNF